MTAQSPAELRDRIDGLLSFPVTPFAPDGEIDVPRYREHVAWMLENGAGALFACGGTGEFFSLSLEEYRRLVRATVEEAAGRVPIVAGVGYGAGLAAEFARAAEEVGADGLLALPPYLLVAEQEGLRAHYAALASATRLGLILYQRDNAMFAPETVARLAELPQVIGFKDGLGEMERLVRMRLTVGDRLLWMNGMPTAELSAPAFLGVGVRHYSSAVYNFVPEIAVAFRTALNAGDAATVERLLAGFYRPFAELRDRGRGDAVARVKAGGGVRGARPAGPVRPPLVDPSGEDLARLRVIIQEGLVLLGHGVDSAPDGPSSRTG